MAFASVGSLGSAHDKTLAATISLSPTSNVPVGHLVVVCYTSTQSGTGVALNGLWFGCYDSVGNQYAGFVTAGGGNTSTIIWVSQLNYALTTTDTISVQRWEAGATNTKAVSLWEFTVDGAWSLETFQQDGNSGVDPAAQTISGLASREHLFLHALGSNGPATDSYTLSTHYTGMTQDGTTGGAGNTNWTIVPEFRILTGTGDTVDITNNSEAPGYAQQYVALREYSDTVPFPSTPILDTFTRADESPIAGGWNTSGWNIATAYLAVVFNAAADRANDSGFPAQVWATAWSGTDVETYATITAIPNIVDAPVGTLIGQAPLSHFGTSARWRVRPQAIYGYGGRDCLTFGNQPTNIEAGGAGWYSTPALVAGNKLGVRTRGTICQVWTDTGDGWKRWGARPIQPSAIPPLYSGLTIYINGGGNNQVARMDDFGGGAVVSAQHLLPILGVGA